MTSRINSGSCASSLKTRRQATRGMPEKAHGMAFAGQAKTLLKLLTGLLTLLNLHGALANDPPLPAIDDSKVSISIIEPTRNVGYTVGDILQRTVTLEVKKPYTLVQTSLPIVGYEHRYKGQVSGIELRSISSKSNDHNDSTRYTLQLAYQVFTSSVVVKPAILPAEIIRLQGVEGGKIKLYDYRIPSWEFRISPVAVYGAVKIENDISPLQSPLLLDARADKLRLRICLITLAVALLGLLYILGRRAWLPRMGAPFARAYRELRKLPGTEAGLQQAASRIHRALNLTAGHSVFITSLDEFLALKPAFLPVKTDLEYFFGLSQLVFFEQKSVHQASETSLQWLTKLCRRCRDCERGLVPESTLPSPEPLAKRA